MKGETSLKKKKNKQTFLQQKSVEETTPRVKKSYSLTNTNYLQLQLDTSGKKRQTLEKTLAIKQKRIHQLQQQVKANQHLVNETLVKWRTLNQDLYYEKKIKKKLHIQLTNSIDMFTILTEKCKEYLSDNLQLQKQNKLNKQKLEFEAKKYRQLKQKRRIQKIELRSFIIPLVQSYLDQNKPKQQLKL